MARNYWLSWRRHALSVLLLVCGVVGFTASFILTVDKIHLLQNPSFVPNCNLNPIFSCGSVMKSPQASVFGFTNSLIGVGAFAALIMLGLTMLAGARFSRWFWLLVQTVAALGLVFAHWLMFESLYRLGTLCPFCMLVWIVTIPTFLYITHYSITNGYMTWIPRRLALFLRKYHKEILLVWFLLIAALVVHRFWYYFETFI